MHAIATRLMLDEAGYVASAELVLIATVGVLALVVGLSSVSMSINNELADVANAFGSVNQSFQTSGMNGQGSNGFGGNSFGSQNDFGLGGSGGSGGYSITSTAGTGER